MLRHNFLSISSTCFVLLTLVSAKVRQLSSDSVRSLDHARLSPETPNVNRDSGFHSAILVAGSYGYHNYRHQSDMCHAFQMLKKKGVPSDDIIVFVYDDIARSYRNLYPGKMYNVPGGYDVYPGCAKDYTGWDVNKAVLMAVLRGDVAAVKGKGSGRVLKQNSNQRVFFAYSAHGAVGLLPFPTGPFLYADEFNKLLIELRERSVFKEILVYIEACYSGSMFYGMPIEKEERILAVSAAGPHESSYATFCPGPSTRSSGSITPEKIGSCMGDLFTVSWIVDAEHRNVFQTLVSFHLERAIEETSVDQTYNKGSHVQIFGDTACCIRAEFLGMFFSVGLKINTREVKYKQADADLVYLYLEASKNNNTEASLQLEKELAMRRHTDEVIYNSLRNLVGLGDLPADTPVSQFAEEAISRKQGESVVNDWDCLRGMVAAWEDKCGRLNSYSGLYSRTFVNLCNALVTPAAFKESIKCQKSVFEE